MKDRVDQSPRPEGPSGEAPEQVFVDPMIHSERVARARVAALVGLAGLLLGMLLGLGLNYPALDRGLLLMMASVVAAGLGLGYYMQVRGRVALMEYSWLKVSDAGLVSMLPAGEVRVRWEEVAEVRVNFRAARGKATDIMILTERGTIRAALRFAERGRPLPEPLLVSGGARLRAPDGTVFVADPGHSPLLLALRRRLPPEKIKLGAILSV